MQVAFTIISPLFAIIGVLVGGTMTSRIQRRNHEIAYMVAIERERQDACVELLAAFRRYRRFLMYSDPAIEEIPPSNTSEGTVIISGASEYISKYDEAFSRLLIVARSNTIIEEAAAMNVLINNFAKLRARHGKGMVPNEYIKELIDAERSFASLVRSELDRKAVL